MPATARVFAPKRRLIAAFTVIASTLVLAHASAEPPGAPSVPRPPPALTIPFDKYTLPNGLEVILHADRSLPLVAVNIWYHVGPSNEPKGRSGFAHLFEHLMFEGSAHVGHEFDRLLESAGATNSNGTTDWDRTDYFETVPREHLELVLWLESDRMGFLTEAITQSELDVQRGVVKNERRQTYENAPYGRSTLALLDTLFPKGHPYHGAVIGEMADLDAATLDDVRVFFRSYYAPSNATLCIAGDIDADKTKKLVSRYFATLPARPKPKKYVTATPPVAQATRQFVDEPVELARVSMGYIAPPAYGPDDAPLQIATAILAGGKATRMYRELVVTKQVASDVNAEVDAAALASIVTVSAMAASGHGAEELEKQIDAVIAGLATTGPTGAELERARRRILVELMSELQLLNGPGGETGRAGMLQRFNHYLADPGALGRWMAAIDAVRAPDVARVVKSYLKPSARAVIVTRPSPKPNKAQK